MTLHRVRPAAYNPFGTVATWKVGVSMSTATAKQKVGAAIEACAEATTQATGKFGEGWTAQDVAAMAAATKDLAEAYAAITGK